MRKNIYFIKNKQAVIEIVQTRKLITFYLGYCNEKEFLQKCYKQDIKLKYCNCYKYVVNDWVTINDNEKNIDNNAIYPNILYVASFSFKLLYSNMGTYALNYRDSINVFTIFNKWLSSHNICCLYQLIVDMKNGLDTDKFNLFFYDTEASMLYNLALNSFYIYKEDNIILKYSTKSGLLSYKKKNSETSIVIGSIKYSKKYKSEILWKSFATLPIEDLVKEYDYILDAYFLFPQIKLLDLPQDTYEPFLFLYHAETKQDINYLDITDTIRERLNNNSCIFVCKEDLIERVKVETAKMILLKKDEIYVRFYICPENAEIVNITLENKNG